MVCALLRMANLTNWVRVSWYRLLGSADGRVRVPELHDSAARVRELHGEADHSGQPTHVWRRCVANDCCDLMCIQSARDLTGRLMFCDCSALASLRGPRAKWPLSERRCSDRWCVALRSTSCSRYRKHYDESLNNPVTLLVCFFCPFLGFQLLYTSIFGAYASFLYLRTGS